MVQNNEFSSEASQKKLQYLSSPSTLSVLRDKNKLRTALVSYTTRSSEIAIDIVESLAAFDFKETLIVERITVGHIYFTLHPTMVEDQTLTFAMVVGCQRPASQIKDNETEVALCVCVTGSFLFIYVFMTLSVVVQKSHSEETRKYLFYVHEPYK
jgi:hypothetical protein